MCFNNQTFVLKLDLSTTLVYVSGVDLEQDSIRKYMPTYSLTHGKLNKFNNLKNYYMNIIQDVCHQYKIPKTTNSIWIGRDSLNRNPQDALLLFCNKLYIFWLTK